MKARRKSSVLLEHEVEKLTLQIDKLRTENEVLRQELKSLKEPKGLSKNKELIELIVAYREGGMTFENIADSLNRKGLTNSRNAKLNRVLVSRLFNRKKQELK